MQREGGGAEEVLEGSTVFMNISYLSSSHSLFTPCAASGLEKAKSLLVVKDGKTFIDLIAEQVRNGEM